ncbi:MAG: methionyl-tRNA formyltransferase [Nitrospirae bacterium RBG_13_43_8]|nr:MAG: methionyl-tRNA formyltransferase [Nitrospirae bacterium RBG_13_43_8]
MRIVFFGTPAFAVPFLRTLLESGEEVIALITQGDKKRGRDRMPFSPPVKESAMRYGIRVLQPTNIKDPAFFRELSAMKPEIIIVVAYGMILPSSILNLPPYGCVNVHASLLPKYRGAAPIQWALLNGEKKTGVTTMSMNEGLDTGPILLQEETEIADEDNTETLSEKLSDLGVSLLMKTVRGLKDSSLKPLPQVGTPSYAPPLKKEDGRIDWSKGAAEIFNFVRGMYPWPCAYCYFGRERIKIISAKIAQGSGIPGRVEKVSKKELLVGTGEGLISIIELQPEGKRPMAASAFLQGRKIREGSYFDER